MSRSIGTVLRTLYYLKPKQLVYQIKYRFGIPSFSKESLKLNEENIKFNSFDYVNSSASLSKEPNQFLFLNRLVVFENKIDWNYSTNGKLWLYNLNYFDFLAKPNPNFNEIGEYIKSYHDNYNAIIDGKEAYPTSLRIMNFIKIINQYDSDELRFILKMDLRRLFQSLEFHLLGNHLLENSFALYFSSHLYPSEKKLVDQSIKLLKEQLTEQILEDGGHYERSFMYHQIILGRLLESISISEANPKDWNKDVLLFLREKAELMITWMLKVSNNGQIFQRFNDSVEHISPDASALIELANKLNLIQNKPIELGESGYRILRFQDLLITANIGNITPSYQPGHSHADSLSFTLHSREKPIIVDPGISTYENNTRRRLERSTGYHNTVNINGKNNNEVWSAFRIGRRARVNLLKDSKNYLEAEHNGYRFLKSTHHRSWEIKDSKIIISDCLSTREENTCELNIHLHPEVEIKTIGNGEYLLNNELIILFDSPSKIKLESYEYCEGFNKTISSKRINVLFNQRLTTEIFYENSFHNG